jgi:ubiquinone/menaquinone biosynthesis C-methylase UbiE
MEVPERNFDPDVVKKKFANVLWIYNAWSCLTESKAAARAIELCDIKDGIDFLEVAVGTGLVFTRVVAINTRGTNTGVDLSPDMLAKTEKILKKRKLSNFKLFPGNALKLEFKEGSFDLLINNYMFDLMPAGDFDTISSEFHRILKPGGIVVTTTFSFGYKKIHRLWHFIAREYPGLLTGCRPVSIRENLENAGFKVEAEEQISQNSFPSEVIKARRLQT